MRKLVYLVLVIILIINMIGCTSKVSIDLPKADLQEIKLPETLEISFKPLELTRLKEEKPKENWKLIKSFSFGAVENEQVMLLLYKEGENDNFLKAQLKYKEYTYTLNGEVSSGIFQNGLDEMRHGPITKTSYLLQHQYGDKDIQLFLLGGIELYANGPGLVGYLIYDTKNKTWFQFDEWGVPYLADLDSDGSKELTIQFPGLHMQTPDVQIIKWSGGKLEKSEAFQTALSITAYQPSTVRLDTENKKLVVAVNRPGESDLINLAEVLYKYENGKLKKVQ